MQDIEPTANVGSYFLLHKPTIHILSAKSKLVIKRFLATSPAMIIAIEIDQNEWRPK